MKNAISFDALGPEQQRFATVSRNHAIEGGEYLSGASPDSTWRLGFGVPAQDRRKILDRRNIANDRIGR
ncbi:MAG: hypothetical protein WA673_11690 [Candidatus Acidiferrales bacterium]